jgi:hypothetical protein
MDLQVETPAGPVIHLFTVGADVPDGVTIDEFASHLADAHRMAVRRYHPDDPLAGMSEIDARPARSRAAEG